MPHSTIRIGVKEEHYANSCELTTYFSAQAEKNFTHDPNRLPRIFSSKVFYYLGQKYYNVEPIVCINLLLTLCIRTDKICIRTEGTI